MIFDKPMWPITTRGKGNEKKGRQLYLYKGNDTDYVGTISIYMPSSLYPLIYQVCKVNPKDVRLYVEKKNDRWTFGIETPDSLFDCWYWTNSNLPLWLKKRL